MSALLERLRQCPNPFDDLVRPANAPAGFSEQHVPEIHQADRERLLRVVDRYRLKEYAGYDDLHPTRAVVVVGPRGAGKTHLLESLIYRADRHPQIVAQRLSEDYEASMLFEEYILGQVGRAVRRFFTRFDRAANWSAARGRAPRLTSVS